MSVKLDDNRRLCKVLVSSQTTGEDVIELLKPDDENVYYLVEVWKGCGKGSVHDYTCFQGFEILMKGLSMHIIVTIDHNVFTDFLMKRKPFIRSFLTRNF